LTIFTAAWTGAGRSKFDEPPGSCQTFLLAIARAPILELAAGVVALAQHAGAVR